MPPPEDRPAAPGRWARPAAPGRRARPAAPGPADFTITVDGEPVPVRAGQTVAAALLAAGRRATRRTRFTDRPRGVFCGIGVCFDCLVVRNGEPGVRACLQPAAPGDAIETQHGPGQVRP